MGNSVIDNKIIIENPNMFGEDLQFDNTILNVKHILYDFPLFCYNDENYKFIIKFFINFENKLLFIDSINNTCIITEYIILYRRETTLKKLIFLFIIILI